MLRELLDIERKSLDHFFSHVDLKTAEEVFNLCANCKGMIFFSGVGKSGLVAKKIAMTLTSTGTRSLYLNPMNAIHGDLGMVSQDDIFFMLSKGGESEELLHLIPFIHNKGAKIIAMVCSSNSRLEKAADLALRLPIERELCPYDMAPTVSTTVQMIFGDLLAIALMRHKNFSVDDYASNHPGGRIGRRLVMKVSDLMLKDKDIPICTPNDKLVDILVELSNKKCGCIMVVNPDKELLGIFTDGDLRRSIQKYGPEAFNVTMDKLMTAQPRAVDPGLLAMEAVKVMESNPKHPVTVLPVLSEGKKLVGLIKMHDILQSGM